MLEKDEKIAGQMERQVDVSAEIRRLEAAMDDDTESMGIPSSISCVLKYRFLSKLVPSTIFKMTSGLSPVR